MKSTLFRPARGNAWRESIGFRRLLIEEPFMMARPTTLRTVSTTDNVERLGRFFAIEKELMRVQAARLPDLESWLLKQKIGFFTYEDAAHAGALLARRGELPGGRRDAAALDDATRAALQHALFCAGDDGFCAALYGGVKPLLVRAYRRHLEASSTVSDDPTRQVIERIIADQERQIAWMEGALALWEADAAQKQVAQLAVETVQNALVAAGGIDGAGTVFAQRTLALRPYRSRARCAP